ncbi:MAG TPA: GTPase HflX [bacterium]|nr:GTPase HflX [bacterium]
MSAEKALLAGLALPGRELEAEASQEELARLAESAGAEVVGRSLQARAAPDPATYIGSGKVRMLKEQASALGAGLVVFDDELRPSQQRNLEDALEIKVLDRTQLILDVFASRARTKEGGLQVELAQLSYLLPRLVGFGKTLSRLGGGIGTRGPGESKLEADRRRLRERISQLEREIDTVARTRSLQRQTRKRQRARVAALAGYTNAGKSSLFNALTEAEVYVEDRLFATLDPTVRPLPLGPSAGGDLLLVDTVGFVRKLPHALVASFRATLEEVAEADWVLRVVDCADAEWPRHLESVDEVLAEVYKRFLDGAPQPEAWLVFNKVDALGPTALKALKAGHPEAHFVSALKGQGLAGLKQALRRRMEQGLDVASFLIPHAALGELSRHFGRLHVKQKRWTSEGLRLDAVVEGGAEALEPYRLRAAKGGKKA